jgi:hypothetical protein
VPSTFADSDAWPERAERAKGALAHLLEGSTDPNATKKEWLAIAESSAAVSTTLLGLKPAVVASLLRHSYVLAMVNLHVILGYPLLPIPSQEEFEALIAGAD